MESNNNNTAPINNIGTAPINNIGTTSNTNNGTTSNTNKDTEHIYMALYNPCIYESGYEPLSCHLTRKGANKSIENHIKEEYNKHLESLVYEKEFWYDYLSEHGKSDKDEPFVPSIFGSMVKWKVKKMKLNQ